MLPSEEAHHLVCVHEIVGGKDAIQQWASSAVLEAALALGQL